MLHGVTYTAKCLNCLSEGSYGGGEGQVPRRVTLTNQIFYSLRNTDNKTLCVWPLFCVFYTKKVYFNEIQYN